MGPIPITKAQLYILSEMERGICLIFDSDYFLIYIEGWKKLSKKTIQVLIRRGWIMAYDDQYFITHLGWVELKKSRQ